MVNFPFSFLLRAAVSISGSCCLPIVICGLSGFVFLQHIILLAAQLFDTFSLSPVALFALHFPCPGQLSCFSRELPLVPGLEEGTRWRWLSSGLGSLQRQECLRSTARRQPSSPLSLLCFPVSRRAEGVCFSLWVQLIPDVDSRCL